MGNPFAITTLSNTVSLRDDRTGEATFTVFNALGRPIRGRARIVPDDPATAAWISLVGDAEYLLGTAATQRFSVRIEAPPTAPAGNVRFRLDMIDVANPDENYARGPEVAFRVPEAPDVRKPFPWWIVAVAVVLLVGAVGVTVALSSRPRPPVVVEDPVIVEDLHYEVTDAGVSTLYSVSDEGVCISEAPSSGDLQLVGAHFCTAGPLTYDDSR
jgi:hypothetical protein